MWVTVLNPSLCFDIYIHAQRKQTFLNQPCEKKGKLKHKMSQIQEIKHRNHQISSGGPPETPQTQGYQPYKAKENVIRLA